jgi:hypothetical protein
VAPAFLGVWQELQFRLRQRHAAFAFNTIASRNYSSFVNGGLSVRRSL